MNLKRLKRRTIKQQLIKHLKLSGLLWPYITDGLYCFNFHRIGVWQETPFDPCVFSCDIENFEHYLTFIKANFRVVSLDELTKIIAAKEIITEKLAFITFDDGYSDNYHNAFPILQKLKLPATFFITTSLISENNIPWWDEIAWQVKHCAGKTIKLSDHWTTAITIDENVSRDNIRQVLQQIKRVPGNIKEQLAELRKITAQEIPTEQTQNVFMTWSQVKEMSENNMTIGAHSHTHKVFTSLSEQELDFELTESKRLIELNIAKPVQSLSYPVGGSNTYHNSMYQFIESKGYQLAFTFQTMINNNLHDNRFEIGRFPIDQPFNKNSFREMVLSAK